MTSLVICRGVKILNTNRPFDGDGVKMYVGGPDASDIQYRPNQIVSQNYAPLIYPTSNDVSVATVLSPNAEDTLSYTLPAELVGEKALVSASHVQGRLRERFDLSAEAAGN